jgi:hypothetical protein
MGIQSLSDQPSDILDHICAFVDEPKDILSFALTSRQIYQLVIPDHIEFRHLRCDIRRISLWKKLSELPAIASRFVSLEVIVEDGTDFHGHTIFPTRSKLLANRDEAEDILFDWNTEYLSASEGSLSLQWEEYAQKQNARRQILDRCIQAFVGALQCMSGLARFHWLVAQAEPSSDLFTALLKCPALKDVDIFPKDFWRPDEVHGQANLTVNPDAYGVRYFS